MIDADVLVVGDGPSGCAAAITSAELGLRVAIAAAGARRSSIPESVHPGGLSLLRSLGIGNLSGIGVGPAYENVWHEDGLHGAVPYGFGGPDAPWRARHLRRDKLDAALLARVEACGVAVLAGRARAVAMNGQRVAGAQIGKHTVGARIVIDATGSAQWLRRRQRLPLRRLSAPLICERGHARGTIPHEREPSFHVSHGGWFWLAPLGGGRAAWTSISAGRRLLPAFPEGLSAAGGTERADRSWLMLDAIYGPGYLVAGDAAGHLDPAAGDGVVLALESGRNAALTAVRMLRDCTRRDEAVSAYVSWWRRRFITKARTLALFYARAGLGALLNSAAPKTHTA